jgi:sulfur relay protein TusC/DsrF
MIIQSAPYQTHQAEEMLNFVLALATFEISLTLYVEQEGLWQLLAAQAPEKIQRTPFTRLYSALSTHEIAHIYIDKALQKADPAPPTLLPATYLDATGFQTLLNTHTLILTL